MQQQRGFHSVRQLLDRSVLVSGGTHTSAPSADGFASIELMAPTTDRNEATFSFLNRAGGAACMDGTNAADCVTMGEPRYGHQMVLIDGSATWLNGAVVVVGGDAMPEIFVPVYACDATGQPLDVLGGVIAGVDYCDRAHPKPTLTLFDPES